MSSRSRRGLCAFLALASVGGCATLPSDPVERSLYIDLRKGTQLGEDSGWVIDRLELQAQSEDAMHSVCQVDRMARANLDSWLTGQIALAGGPAERQYRENGGDLDAVEDALELEHVQAVLRHADEHATDDCPFWLTPDPEFRGVQSDADRLVLMAESVWVGAVVIEGGEAAIGGGASGRLFVGHGVGPQATLLIGGEVGGIGAFVDTADEGRSLVTTFTAATPVMLRITRYSRLFDVEVGPVVRLAGGQDILPPGVATSFAAGFATMRSAAWLPYVVVFVGYAYHPPADGTGAEHSARIGTRFGLGLDP